MLGQPVTMGVYIIVVAVGVFICSRGLQNGLEKVTKVMMVALLLIMVVLAVNSFFMDGAKEGLSLLNSRFWKNERSRNYEIPLFRQ